MQQKLIRDASKNLLICVDSSTPVTAISIWHRAGSRFDPQGKEGIAHFLEHLLLRGPSAHNPDLFSREQESFGVKNEAYTNYETMFVTSVGDPRDSAKMLQTLIQFTTKNPTRLRNAWAGELQAVTAERQEQHSDPTEAVRILANHGIWPASDLGRDVCGSPESLSNIQPADVLKFWNEHYQRPTIVCVVPTASAARQISAVLPRQQIPPAIHEPKKLYPPVINELHQPRIGDGATLCIAFRIPGAHSWKDQAVATILRNYLANFWSSRLVYTLRTLQGATYWVQSEVAHLSDSGVLRIILQTDSSKLTLCRKAINKELQLLRRGKIDTQSFRTTKHMSVLSYRRSLTNIDDLIWWYGWPAALGARPISCKRWLTALQSVTAQDVEQFAKTWLQEKDMVTAILD